MFKPGCLVKKRAAILVNHKVSHPEKTEDSPDNPKPKLRHHLKRAARKTGHHLKKVAKKTHQAIVHSLPDLSFLKIDKRALYAGIPLMIVLLIGYSFYMLNLENYSGEQNVLVYGQNNFESGSEASLRIVALTHKDGEPIEGAYVTIKAMHKETERETVLFEGRTDERGSPEAEFVIPEELEGEYELSIEIKSRHGSDNILRSVKIDKAYKILLTSDKPLYQPGQTMHVRTLSLRNSDSRPADGEEVTIEVEDSKGNKVFRKRSAASEYGIAATEFTLANEINYGRYTIRASIGDYSAEKKVEVKKYVLPKFKVSLETEKPYYLPGQKISGTVNADYFFGKPAASAKVDVKLYTYGAELRQIGRMQGRTDSAGVYVFEFELPSYLVGLPLEKGSGLVFFNASVTDQAGHAEQITSSVPVAKEPIEIELVPESGGLAKGIENVIYVITTYPDGTPAPSTVRIRGNGILTNEYGLGEFTIVPEDFFLRLTATAADTRGNRGTQTVQFPGDYVENPGTDEEWRRNERYRRDGYRTESVLLRVDKSILEVGDAVRLDVFYTGSSGTVYVDVIKDGQTSLTKALDAKDGKASLELDLDESMAGTLELHAYKILRNSDVVRDSRTIFVNHGKGIVLEIEPGKDSYLPGEEARITFRTTKNALPIPAAIGVNIVDESVFALQEREAGFERLYFELEKELLKPRYVIYGITLPELIYGPDSFADEETGIMAGNVLMAAADGEDRFSLKAHSRPEKELEIENKKEEYFSALYNLIKIILLLLPLLIFGLAIYDHRKEKKTLLMDIFLSVGSLIGVSIFLSFALFMLGLLLSLGGYQNEEFVAAILSFVIFVVVALTTGLVVWAVKKDHFISYLVLALLIPFELVLLAASLTEVVGYGGSELVLLAFAVLAVIAAICSLVFLIMYAKNNNQDLLWMTLFFIIYVFILPVLVFAGIHADYPDMDSLVWVFLSALLIPVAYGSYAIDFVRMRSRLAVPAFFIAMVLIVLSLFFLFVYASLHTTTFLAAERGVAWDAEADFMERGYLLVQTKKTAYVASDSGPAAAGERPRLRQFFPETLYSAPQVITDGSGKATINLEVADSITSWRITALANSLNGDVGSNNAEMLVFQDFFVDIDLPISLTQGDEVSIPVSAFNYLKTPQSVRLEFQDEPWFELLDKPSKTLDLEANDAGVAYFRIKALKLGNNKLTAYAYGSEKSDAVSRTVGIVPDGKEYRTSHSDRLDGSVEKIIIFPSEAIDDSERLFVKIYPGIFSQVVEGLDSMFRVPHGCFEQTSSITYPNVLVLDYMKKTRQINPEIQFKAEQYIGTGYQRLMSFESDTGGGWTWFGPPEEANMMLSAYGLTEFHDMAQVYEIDDSLIERTQNYLVSRMKEDGSFGPEGRLHTSGLRAGSDKLTSTCFVGWSLAYTGYDGLLQTAEYIEENVDLENEDSYTLALCANALAHYDRKKSLPILRELDDRAVKGEKTIHWESASGEGYGRTVMGGQGRIKALETTSLAALAYIEAGYGGTDVNRILTYIVNQKDSHGSWGTTFATILSLKAMINALSGTTEDTDATIRIFVDNELAETITIDESNADVLQLVELNEHAGKGDVPVRIEMQGQGNLFYQIVGAYHLDWDDVGPPSHELISIALDYDRTTLSVNDVITAKVNAAYHGEGFVNNAIIDLGIPPGFSVVSEDLQEAVEKGFIEKYDVTGRQIIIYLRFLDKEGISLEYGLKAKYPIKAKTPKSAVYDYYNPELRDEAEPVEFNVE